jgi:DNA primase
LPVLSSSEKKSLVDRVLKYHEQLKSPDGAPLLAYLTEERQLSPETIDRFLLGAVVSPDVLDDEALGMIAIPYITPTGPVALRFRRPPTKETGPKYWQPSGSILSVFNTPALLASEDVVAITEGEFDCMILAQAGINAVGIPGASAWKDHFDLLFEGYREVIVCADNDDKVMKNGEYAGRKFATSVAKKVPGPRLVLMPEGYDINSYYCAFGREALREHLGVE